MKINEKLACIKTHISSIMRHDDESIAARTEASAKIKEMIETELAEAAKRETPERIEQRDAEMGLVKAREKAEKFRAKKKA